MSSAETDRVVMLTVVSRKTEKQKQAAAAGPEAVTSSSHSRRTGPDYGWRCRQYKRPNPKLRHPKVHNSSGVRETNLPSRSLMLHGLNLYLLRVELHMEIDNLRQTGKPSWKLAFAQGNAKAAL